jgi:outer membrane protein assembly factor BamB
MEYLNEGNNHMFDQQEITPWYRSKTALIVSSLLLPPLGIVLLWIRTDADRRKKVIGSLCIVVFAAGYLYLVFGVIRPRVVANAHYEELERHRAQQAQEAQNAGNVPGAQPGTAQPGTANGAANGTDGTNLAHADGTAPGGNYWTDFRGPNRDGRYDEKLVQTKWPEKGLPQIWKQPVGIGYASFVVADGRAYTIEQRRAQEVVTAYDVVTGRELWAQGWTAEFKDDTGDGPRSTPTWNEGRLYAVGATGELRCLDATTGKVIWGKNILSDNGAENIPWGVAASPLVVDDKLVVMAGGSGGKSVVAYNKMTGAPVWKALSDQSSYTSPMLVTLAGRRQVLAVTASRAAGLAPEDGSVIWETEWSNSFSINVSQPIIVDKNRFFLSAGYGKGAALVEVTGSGKTLSARKVWENVAMKNKFNSSVLHNGYVYGLDEGILTCLDVNTGERKWKGGRYGYGQVLLASGHLIVITDTGELALVAAVPDKYSELSRFSALSGKTWNVPAIADGRLLVRNATEMACFNLAVQ